MLHKSPTLFLTVLLSVPCAAQPLVHEGVVAAPPGQVWAAWTTSAGVSSWMAPLADIELKIGGKMRANYDPAGTLGDAQTIENTVLSFDPERMLSIQVNRAPAGFPFPNAILEMWTVVYFEAQGEHTRVRIVCNGLGEGQEAAKMREFFERGNAYTLKKLQSRFQPAAP